MAAPILPAATVAVVASAPAAAASEAPTRHPSDHERHIATKKHAAHKVAEANRKARLAAARHAKILAGAARARVLAAARSALGRPYRYGAAGPAAFDCSGFTQWSYRAAGKHLPRTAAAQGLVGHATTYPKPGDLVVWRYSNGIAYHVGILSRQGWAYVARHSGTDVEEQRLNWGHPTYRVALT